MAEITVDLIKKLREKTQVGMMDCKKALMAANGDFDQAVEDLRKKGAAVAAKRAENETNNGTVAALVSPDFTHGVITEISCETDFSANTDAMRTFAKNVASAALAHNTDNAAGILGQSAPNSSLTIQGELDEIISKIAEKITVSRVANFSSDGLVNAYVHAGSTLGVLIDIAVDGDRPADLTPLVNAAKDVCMQIAVNNPICVSSDELDQDLVAKERAIYAEQLKAEGKPEQIIEKIMPGKLSKFYEQVCLNNQKFIKEDKITIQQLLDRVGKENGCSLTIKRFARFAIG